MGYTHYWHVKDMQAVARALPLVANDLKRLLPKLPPLAGPDGKGNPILGPTTVEFNGVAPDDYETLWLGADPRHYLETEQGLFNFCKTQHRPYDLAVQVVLVLLKYHTEFFKAYSVTLSSDGNMRDWVKACRLVEGLGYPVDPTWALGREVWRVKTQAGEAFYVEWPSYSDKNLAEWLERFHQRGVIPFAPPFSFHGPLTGYPPGKPIQEGSRIYATRGR